MHPPPKWESNIWEGPQNFNLEGEGVLLWEGSIFPGGVRKFLGKMKKYIIKVQKITTLICFKGVNMY